MTDLSKLTELAGKFDLKGMVSNVKSMINPAAKIPSGIEDDPLGQRVVEIVSCLTILKENHGKMAEELAKLDNAVGGLSQQIVAMKKPQAVKAAVAPEAPAAEAPAKAASTAPTETKAEGK